MKHHFLKLTLMAIALSYLSACHHLNPLKTHSKEQSGLFLLNASANAEERLKFAIQKDAHGYGYLECMEGKRTPEIHCEALYKGMVRFAKEKHVPGFETITLEDLKDKNVFEDLADAYAQIAMTTWPDYYPADQS